jgi:sortase family protein
VLGLGVLGMVAGAVALSSGLRTEQVPDAPLPEHPFSLAAVVPLPPAEGSAATDSARAAGPNRLLIPALGVDAPVVAEPAHEGALVIPGDPATVGRWVGSASVTSAIGTTLLAGHVSVDGRPGALSALARVEPSAVIVTTDGSGRPTLWRVVELQTRAKDDLPGFPVTGSRRLAIVTCGGPLRQTGASRSYRDNVIAYAVPAPTGSDSVGGGT